MSELERVVRTILRYNMFAPGARVGVAVSGGADSVCLLHLLLQLQPDWNLKLTILHLNHCLRGAESDGDERFVRDLAAHFGLPLRAERVTLPGTGDNLEQAAREARRGFFRQSIAEGAAECVATAHTQSDQAETVLFRILRGSYTTGLAGIWPVTPDGIVRPLLWFTRSEVEAYLRADGLEWREDSTNRDLSFARNRLRHEVLPALTREWNPQLPAILARHAELAREDDQFWEAEVDRVVPGRLTCGPNGVVADVRRLAELAPALQRRLVRRAIAGVRGDLRQIDFRHIDEILAISDPAAAGHARLQVPGADVTRSFDWLRFARPGTWPTLEYCFRLAVPGQIELPGSGTVIGTEVIESQKSCAARDTLEENLDWNRVQQLDAELHLRNWRPGDRYRRSGHRHEQKLKELFHEFRVPLWARRGWPVVAAGSQILWARKFGPAAEYAAGAGSSSILRITGGEA